MTLTPKRLQLHARAADYFAPPPRSRLDRRR